MLSRGRGHGGVDVTLMIRLRAREAEGFAASRFAGRYEHARNDMPVPAALYLGQGLDLTNTLRSR